MVQGHARILIVEDESIVALDMEGRLVDLGFSIIGIATSGHQAIKMVDEELPDLILMDVKLKGDMDGIEAAERIKAKHDIPVIFVTAFADEKTLQRAKLTDAFAYILKPFNDREVVISIQIALYKAGIERELRHGKALLEGILDGIDDAVIATRGERDIVFLNKAAERLRTERKGGFDTSFHLESLPDAAPHNARLFSGGKAIPVHYRMLPLPPRDGEAEHLHVIRDYSGHLRLMAAEGRYAAIFGATSDAVFTINSKGLVRSWNEGAVRLYGYSAQEAIGSSLTMLEPDESPYGSFTALALDILVNGGDSRSVESLRKCKDGSLKTVSASMAKIPGVDGAEDELSIIERDISSQKERERSLEEARIAAEETARLKGEFLSNMSHELRTPLNSIIGMTELAMDRLERRDLRDNLSVVLQSSRSLLSLITSILDFSKIEAGKMRLHEAPFSISESICSVLDGLSVQAYKKGLALYWVLDPDCPDGVIGDKLRFCQILSNLASNAVKFTERGFVALRTRRIGRSGGKLGYAFVVEDSGVGIAPDKISTIFEKFTQVDGSSSRSFGGTGLGLSISKGLAELMGGSLDYEPREGGGSRFVFRAAFPTDASGDGLLDLRGRLADSRVVLAFANKGEGEAFEAQLRYLGCETQYFDCAASAMERALDDESLILLLDESLSDMACLIDAIKDGGEIAQNLVRRVIVATGVDSKAEAAWSKLWEEMRFYVKPAKPKGLVEAFKGERCAEEGLEKPPPMRNAAVAEQRPLDPLELGSEREFELINAFVCAAKRAMAIEDWERVLREAEIAKRELDGSCASPVAKKLFHIILSIRKSSFEAAATAIEGIENVIRKHGQGGGT